MSRCGCGGGGGNNGVSCGCSLVSGTRTIVTGAGTPDAPYVVDLAGEFLTGGESSSGVIDVSGTGQDGSAFVLTVDSNDNVSESFLLEQTVVGTPFNLSPLVDMVQDTYYSALMLTVTADTTLSLSSGVLSGDALQRVSVFVRANAVATVTLPPEAVGMKWVGGAAPAPIAMDIGQVIEIEFIGFLDWGNWMARLVTATPFS